MYKHNKIIPFQNCTNKVVFHNFHSYHILKIFKTFKHYLFLPFESIKICMNMTYNVLIRNNIDLLFEGIILPIHIANINYSNESFQLLDAMKKKKVIAKIYLSLQELMQILSNSHLGLNQKSRYDSVTV